MHFPARHTLRYRDDRRQSVLGWLLLGFCGFMPFAQAQLCDGCVDIMTQQTVFKPSESLEIWLDVDAAGVPASKVDSYVAAVLPSGRVAFIQQKLNWQVMNQVGARLFVPSLSSKPLGQYQLHFILSQQDSDPLDSDNWLAATNMDIALLPEDWDMVPGNTQISNAGRLPDVVSHGGGEIAGQIISNSLEALDASYLAGQRFIEVDLSWTADGHLVLIHDWGLFYQRFFSQPVSIPDLETFRQLPMNFGLTQMTLTDLVAWMEAHKDVKIITDIKERNLQGLAYLVEHASPVIRQFVPQFYSVDEYLPARQAGFQNLIFTLYRTSISDQALFDFAEKNPVVAITMPATRAINAETAQGLAQRGVAVYTHTINQREIFGFVRRKGVKGIYSDSLLPQN
ncbi:MAG: glycerophosphodiester phosphodiesterase family protein [Pseudomonadales bacterium]|nr:glycerophosphodiester phosphodiesterase family protein [Pseudomonadales bacterium]